MIFTNYGGTEFLMPHSKFYFNQSIGLREDRFLKVFTMYGHGRYLGHVTSTIYINFGSLFPKMFHMKFGFDWPMVTEGM